MVIQRWQSVLLLIAVVALVIFLCLPVGCYVVDQGSYPWKVVDCMPVFIVGCLNGLLLLIDIFLYGNLRLQKRIAAVCLFMTLIELAGVVACVLGVNPQTSADFVWEWPVIFPVIAIVAILWARARMAADERLLRSYDRLR